MSSAVVSRQLQAPAASTSGRPAVPIVFAPSAATRRCARPLPVFGIGCSRQRPELRALAKKDRKGSEPSAPQLGEATDSSPFIEPLLRGLVLGVGAGVLCEVLHVAFKVSQATDGGSHLPSPAQIYEQLQPHFVWDHAVAISFWLLFYVIEAAAILAILREYPDDKQAVIRSTVTLPKRLMPLTLSSVKKALHTLVNGKAPQAAQQGAAPMAIRGGSSSAPQPRASGGGAAVLERPSITEPKPQQPGTAPKPAPQEPKEPNEPQHDDDRKPASAASLAQLRRSAGLKPGQLDPASPLVGGKTATGNPKDALEAKRAKELADRRAYLQNFWYAAALSEKVSSKPIKVDIMSRTVTIWRGEDGKVHCLDNVCPHRGAPLSGGWTKTKNGKSCVVCPYHGWAFNGEGSLEEVPSQSPELAFPRRPLVDSYPVEERGGFVWLFFGSKSLPADERPPIPMVPELEDPKWRAVYGEMEFDCAHWSVFENALDMAHIHYLHNGSFGNQDKPVINDMDVTRDTWSVGAKFSIHNKPVNPLWKFSEVPAVPVEARAMLPSTSYVKITLGGGIQMITYVNTVPIDENRAINRFCLIRNFALSPIFDGYTRKSMFKILGEDKEMIELLKPEQIRSEVSLEADKPQIAYRKLRQEWIDMGYGVQPEEVAKHSGSLRLDM
ncbi:hypothetical protein GPECTOR_15g450 [Gonium pectorale]|uniref:Rieske domain-containing protein n=1 Tax=Gonium pectorale TaxID=33097 RepID=A0A150GLZ0_GONPE|nr:hypothetical protein GPECTOR_15g450 [Gonium pectorale]|eukprot:KXZ50765.1 hypothetical protein GPECTOR_15g450 [Gonium pectorale]